MVNALLPLLHGVVVVVAIGAAVTATSPRAASSPSTDNKRNLDSAWVQVVTSKEDEAIAERNSVQTHGDVLLETGSAGNGRDREVGNDKDLCGNTTTAGRYSHSRFCSVNSSSTTRNLRGPRIVNSNPSHHHRNKKVVESSAKSPNEDGRKRKRFLRWAGDDELEEMNDKNSRSSAEQARHDNAAATAAAAVGIAAERDLRAS